MLFPLFIQFLPVRGADQASLDTVVPMWDYMTVLDKARASQTETGNSGLTKVKVEELRKLLKELCLNVIQCTWNDRDRQDILFRHLHSKLDGSGLEDIWGQVMKRVDFQIKQLEKEAAGSDNIAENGSNQSTDWTYHIPGSWVDSEPESEGKTTVAGSEGTG
jgi:hypothetical protein